MKVDIADITEAIEKNVISEEIIAVLKALLNDAPVGLDQTTIDLADIANELPAETLADVLNTLAPASGEHNAPLHGRFQDAMYMQMPHIDLATGEAVGSEMSAQAGGLLSIAGGLGDDVLGNGLSETPLLEGNDAARMGMMMKFGEAQSLFNSLSVDDKKFEAREINGLNNNLGNAEYGSTGSNFITTSGYQYGDGVSTPNDLGRPSARAVSNAFFSQSDNIYNHAEVSNFLWVWGQFVDHDINLTREGGDGGEDYAIEVPAGDAYFDPRGTGEQTIGFTRSGFADGTGTDVDNPRTQVNDITAFIDASNVYGSTAEVAASLRGENGLLRLSAGDLLPLGEGDHGPEFKAGDARANENSGLTSMHTVFAREHNFWAQKIAAENPSYTDDETFEAAKAFVEAEIQHITYDEFLPSLLGQNALTDYQGYDPSVNPQITAEFATAAFRVGHTMLSSDIFRMQADGVESEFGHLSLKDAFFRPDIIMREGGIDEALRGIGASYSQNIDGKIIDDVRNFLFGPPGAGGFDLVSLNIQRGRDHGIADYNTAREAYGLDAVESFDQLVNDPAIAAKLTELYGDINHLDLWVGGLLEEAHGDGLVGETFFTIIADQFTRLRDGDRFFYEDRLSDDLVELVQDTSLSDIIMRNTDIEYLQDDLFTMKNRVGGADGNDVVEGTESGDLLIGFDGDDVLNGHGGADVMYGGAGNDVFAFDDLSGGMDVIRDFVIGEDRIDISGVLDGYNPLTDAIEDFVSTAQSEDGLTISVDQDGSNDNNTPQNVVFLEGIQSDNVFDLLITQQAVA